MKSNSITNLCFNEHGLINSEAINFIIDNNIESIVLFGDGSAASFDQIKSFQLSAFSLTSVKRIGIFKTPKFEIRVVNLSGEISKPNYCYDDDVRIKWICARVCVPHMEIYGSRSTSQNTTEFKLEKKQAEAVCFMGYKLWSDILVIEERMAFPAVIIETLSKFTYYLTRETMNIEILRHETGIESLAYSSESDVLSVIVANDLFSIKVSVLNQIYGEIILPRLRGLNDRKLKFRVSIKGLPHYNQSPVIMSYGQIGRVVEDMRIGCRERAINVDSPIDTSDLVIFAKKAKADAESTIWVDSESTISKTIDEHRSEFMRSACDNSGYEDIE